MGCFLALEISGAPYKRPLIMGLPGASSSERAIGVESTDAFFQQGAGKQASESKRDDFGLGTEAEEKWVTFIPEHRETRYCWANINKPQINQSKHLILSLCTKGSNSVRLSHLQ